MQAGAGMAVLLLLITPLIWSAPAALMTAELSSAIPEEGGYYIWVRRALGQPWGFLCGWWTWVYSWVDSAIYPTLFAAYLGQFLELIGYSTVIDSNPWVKWLVGLIIIVPLTLLNLRGTRSVGEGSVSFFVVLLIPFVILVALGMSRVIVHPSAIVHPFVATGKGASGAFGVGLFAVMWNYLGWDSMSTVSGEVENPQKTFPKALAYGVPIVALSYLLPAVVGLVVIKDPEQWKEGAWVQIAMAVGGKWLAVATTAAGIVSSAGLFSATLLASSRIPFVMSEEGRLPKVLSRLHPKWNTPWVAILISAFFYTAFSYEKFSDLTVVDVVLYSSALLLEFVALIVLRKKEPELPRPFQIPGGWPVVIAVSLAPAALILFACFSRFQEKGSLAVWSSVIALGSGPLVYGMGALLRRKERGPLG